MSSLTKKAIRGCFLRLLEQYPLSEISVRMIAEECGINRKSFYYHYRDIPALLEEIISDGADSIIADYNELGSVEDCLAVMIDTIIGHKNIIRHVFGSVSRDIFEENLLKVCDYLIRSYVASVSVGFDILPDDKELVIGYYRGLCFGLILEWMSKGMRPDIRDSFHRICTLRHGMVDEMMRRMEESRA